MVRGNSVDAILIVLNAVSSSAVVKVSASDFLEDHAISYSRRVAMWSPRGVEVYRVWF